jgi:hypothetical protein
MPTEFQVDVYCGGIMDKTVMDEAVSPTLQQSSAIWVKYLDLL